MRHFNVLHSNVTPQALGAARIMVFGLAFYNVWRRPFTELSELPIEMFARHGFFRLIPLTAFETLLQPAWLNGLRIALLVLAVLAMLGMRPYRPIALLAAALSILRNVLIQAFGFVSHTELNLLYAVFVLALFPAADGLSVLGRRKTLAPTTQYTAPMMAVPAVLCLTYMFIATRRLLNGGLGIFTGDMMPRWLVVRSLESLGGYDYGLLAVEYPWFGGFVKVGFVVTTLFELLSPLYLIAPWWFRLAWLAVIVPFHFMTLFTMNIFFHENLFLIAVFMTPLTQLLARLFESRLTRSEPLS